MTTYASDVYGSNSVDIGDIVFDTERGSKFARKSKVFSRCGTIYPAGLYPKAAIEPGLMVNGLPSTIPNDVKITGWATNGTVIVAAYDDSNYVLVSTSPFSSWANVAHNATVAINDIVYNPSVSKFIGVGCNGSIVQAASSTSGTGSWVVGGSITGTSPIGNTVRAACDGTNVLLAWINSTSVVATTTDGSALTSRSLPGATISTPPHVTVLPSLGATRWIIGQCTANWFRSTTAGATAFSAVTFPVTSTDLAGLAAGNGVIVAFLRGGSQTYYTSTNGSTFTPRGIPGAGGGNLSDNFMPPGVSPCPYNWCRFDGSVFVTGTAHTTGSSIPQGIFGYSTDGIEWTTRQLAYYSTTPNSCLAVMSVGGNLATLPALNQSQAGAQYSTSWKTTCNYVGKARPVSFTPSAPTMISMAFVGYVRIK